MTIAITSAPNETARRDSGAFDCGGAQVRAHCRHLATVLSVRGEIDGVNADRVGHYLQRFVLGDTPLVVDLSEVSAFAAAGISMLYGLDEYYRAAGVEWTLVASPAVGDLLDDDFPTTRTLHESLQNLADAIVSRRQSVLPLIRKSGLAHAV